MSCINGPFFLDHGKIRGSVLLAPPKRGPSLPLGRLGLWKMLQYPVDLAFMAFAACRCQPIWLVARGGEGGGGGNSGFCNPLFPLPHVLGRCWLLAGSQQWFRTLPSDLILGWKSLKSGPSRSCGGLGAESTLWGVSSAPSHTSLVLTYQA